MEDLSAAAGSRVYVDMVGDLFHAGHVSLLREARRHGDRLIVGVLFDEVIADAPYQVTEEFLAEHRITTVVHGDDLSPEGAALVYGPAAAAGRLVYVRRVAGISTTQLIQRVLDAASREE